MPITKVKLVQLCVFN